MRDNYQILAIPYRKMDNKIEYAILKRKDMDVWQGVAGGGEEGESVIESAKREINEEIGISVKDNIIPLDTVSSIPVYHFKQKWAKDVFVIKEYAFGVEVLDEQIELSDEHTEFKWCTYETAMKLLNWDSNKTALWELNERVLQQLSGR